ncbi:MULTISPECIES: hypothetical protein [Pseudomonadati]|uniref:Uncharacterized protein n=1 Tax=Shewanella aestuarii TaxID=1028752 RepID=A0ABT0KYP5_9GAMM|nr:hypothetical protein [Shewanella aestuarii]MCL1116593.1 hypothetical protein [Shewanella aestuarii]GGN72262.1 hypothetical protein GCM10009193_09010 [Shewanella aestuarii]
MECRDHMDWKERPYDLSLRFGFIGGNSGRSWVVIHTNTWGANLRGKNLDADEPAYSKHAEVSLCEMI